MSDTIMPRHGGQDPDDMNDKRIVWGLSLASYCSMLTGADPEDAVSDAIAYLLHAAPVRGEYAPDALRRAVAHFNAETGKG